MEHSNFSENFKAACARKGTNISTVLEKICRASSNTGNWKKGKFPRIDIAMEIAEYLQISTDELIYGLGNAPYANKTHKYELDPEWIEIIDRIPENRQQMCKDFLRTHMIIPEKYTEEKKA